jgi:hypothetical protein
MPAMPSTPSGSPGSSPRSPRASAPAFPPLPLRCAAAAAFHTPDPRTGRALSHPAERLARAHAALTARGAPLAPPDRHHLLARLDALLERPLRRPASLQEEAADASDFAAP